MAEEHLVYRGGDWANIANDLDKTDPFTWHLKDKAETACGRFGPDKTFGETVAPAKALDIRKAAHLRGIQ